MSTTPYTDAILANPLTPVSAALFALAKSQYNANPPSTWGNRAAAAACLDALYFLVDNRASDQMDANTRLQYEMYSQRITTLQTRLGTVAPSASGRSRRVTASFAGRDRIG